jgi:heparan-alpha-glucosaminide N-acetyltransferase
MSANRSSAVTRIASVDAYRGLVMFLMMAEILELSRVASALPNSAVWTFLGYHQTHMQWQGCSLHDLIQPSFSFLVGVALPFSIANRIARGQSTGRMLAHAAWRALVLILLGVFLRSIGAPRTNFTFEDTLSQIGLGYFFLFLLGLARPLWSWLALAAILVGYWGVFALYPLPGPDFDYAVAGVPPNWPYNFTGFAAHWNKNTNAAWAFDRWFLNLFPRNTPFTYNKGGYSTLSFIPTLGTMILGLIAGRWLNGGSSPWRKVGSLILMGLLCLAGGLAANSYGICPIVKRIWTPSWILSSGGWCFLILAGFHAVMDVIGFRAWGFPLLVIGANSIVAYCMARFRNFIVGSFNTHLGPDFFKGSFQTHLGQFFTRLWDPVFEHFALGVAVLVVYWLVLLWMYRQKIFVRI